MPLIMCPINLKTISAYQHNYVKTNIFLTLNSLINKIKYSVKFNISIH